jgi:hypothetical protein
MHSCSTGLADTSVPDAYLAVSECGRRARANHLCEEANTGQRLKIGEAQTGYSVDDGKSG